MTDIRFEPQAWDHYLWWQGQDKRTLRRINSLLLECLRTPHEGTGKPEPLHGELAGYWTRRIDQANRLVYTVDDAGLVVTSCRDHYA
jgi:toxin YoeB